MSTVSHVVPAIAPIQPPSRYPFDRLADLSNLRMLHLDFQAFTFLGDAVERDRNEVLGALDSLEYLRLSNVGATAARAIDFTVVAAILSGCKKITTLECVDVGS